MREPLPDGLDADTCGTVCRVGGAPAHLSLLTGGRGGRGGRGRMRLPGLTANFRGDFSNRGVRACQRAQPNRLPGGPLRRQRRVTRQPPAGRRARGGRQRPMRSIAPRAHTNTAPQRSTARRGRTPGRRKWQEARVCPRVRFNCLQDLWPVLTGSMAGASNTAKEFLCRPQPGRPENASPSGPCLFRRTPGRPSREAGNAPDGPPSWSNGVAACSRATLTPRVSRQGAEETPANSALHRTAPVWL
jgi:hypothetical protein